jgi:hypothetical protein
MSLRSRSQHTFPQISSPKPHSHKNSKEDYMRLVVQHAWLEESCTFFSPKKLDEDLGNVMHARKRVSRNCALLQQQEKHNCTIFLEKHSRADVMHFTKLWRGFKGPGRSDLFPVSSLLSFRLLLNRSFGY